MKKFQFKYHAVLKERQIKEKFALELLADAQHAYQTEVEQKLKLIETLEKSQTRKENLGRTPVQIQAFQAEQDFITGTKQKILQSDQKIFKAQKNIDRAMKQYIHAKRRTEIIEELKEKSYQEYRKERNRFEQKQLDDSLVMRAHLKEGPL
jgi:flagellar export protein FliJ